MNDRSDQPRDPESGQVPPHAGAEDPTVEQPRPEAETAKLEEPAEAAKSEDVEKPAEETTAANAQQAPPAPGQVPPAQGQAAYGPPPPGWVPAGLQAPPRRGGFRRFAGHRATQLVGVGLLGMLIGGGIVGGIAAATFHDGGRPSIHRSYDGGSGNRGPGNFDGRGGYGG
jgi:hypothetical protein